MISPHLQQKNKENQIWVTALHFNVQDVAATYSKASKPSRWWVDLDDQLDHYINHGKALQNAVVDWRNDMVSVKTIRKQSIDPLN